MRHSAVSVRKHAPLDPCTLGRPFHLLDEFKQRLGWQLLRHLGERFNQRHGADFALRAVSIGAYKAGAEETSWRSYAAPAGGASVRLDRRLLLAMLGYHYGEKGEVPVQGHAPETETERRFAIATGLALAEVLRACVVPPVDGAFVPAPLRLPVAGDRVIRIELAERRLDLCGQLEIAIDDVWLSLIFASTAPRRISASSAAKNRAPLAERLPITLSARMLTREVLLDDVMRLAPGDVMPVRLPDTAEVLVGDTRLFQAVVAEHNGTLCLTSLENIE